MVGKREEEGVNWLFGIATKYDLTLEQVHCIDTEFMARYRHRGATKAPRAAGEIGT